MAREFNIITATDSYKVSHWEFYPEGTEYVRSYLEARVGARYAYTLFFGLQYILKEYLTGVVVTKKKIDKAERRFNKHFMGKKIFNRAGWEYILKVHGGKLPIRIRAVREGTVVGISNVLMTVENTDPNCAWLVNYLETLLVQVWYPITVATRSHYLKQVISDALVKSGDPNGILFKLHDFGFRGVSSVETAAIGGAAHLINFWGTDTFAGIELLEDYYSGDPDPKSQAYPAFSIPATEHSTITGWGKDKEPDAFENILNKHQDGLVACVIDSYDPIHFVREYVCNKFFDKIMGRNGTLVLRPDSGDPHTHIPEILAILWEKYGGEINDKGFKVLDSHVRVIQGDGIDDRTVGSILLAIMTTGFSADNIAFGSGGGLLQKLDRDTQRFAFKCSEIVINGVAYDVFKQPSTDPTKNSKKGNLKLVRFGTDEVTLRPKYKTVRLDDDGMDELVTPYANGDLLMDQTLEEIRNLAA